MKRFLILVALIGLFSGLPAMGLDDRDARQTAGIYLNIDGRMHSVFGDFNALRYIEGDPREVSFSLTSDLDLWIEGRKVPVGRKNWTFRVDAKGVWTLGEGSAAGGDAARFRVPHRESQIEAPYLTASFHFDPDAKAIVLRFGYGDHSGKILLRLECVDRKSAVSTASLDMIRGRQELKRLREIVGLLMTEQKKRPAWSGILVDLGAALVEAGADSHLTVMSFTEEENGVTLSLTGQTAGGQAAADKIAAALRVGNGPRIFSHVSRPVARLADGGQTWNFELIASAPLSKWSDPAKVEALSDGQDPSAVAIELLLLEARLSEATAASPLRIADVQPRLLSAKRVAGVMLSHVSSGGRDEVQGLIRFPVSMRVTGSGAAILTFIRNLEDCRASLTIMPDKIVAGIHSCQVDLTVVFHDYVPLAKRLPKLHAAIVPMTRRPGYEQKVDLYLLGVGPKSPSPFVAPDWPRDPFSIPGE